MTEPPDHEHDVLHAIEHPVETAEEVREVVNEGRSPWTPFLALTGVTLFVAVAVVVLLVIAFLAYYLAR